MSSGQAGSAQHGTSHSRAAAQNDHHGYRHSRDGPESQTHGQRSKSTSHHHHQAHHSRGDGGHGSSTTGQHENMGAHNRSAHQPRSHSQAKGQTTSTNAARESHHHNQNSSTAHASAGATNNAHTSGTAGRSSNNNHASSNANAVGHYILGKALGEGTFGKVKLGTHVLTGEKVAVKVLEKSKIKDKKDVERISREIKILKQLHHPNVVQIYEIIETDKDLYLVMEFASGGELFELIVQNQKLKERSASKHLQELLAGVHYIHQLGICHRDLKPENLLLDFDGQLKIVDFGLSNMYEKGQTLKTACGSPCYAAPEMIAGNRYHGLKSDIWSCGVVLYAMLCGYLPFEDQKTSNLYKKIMNAEYQLPKFLSNDAKDILSKIFVTDPNKRIDIEGLKQHPWYRLYQPENQNYGYHNVGRSVNDKLVMKMEASLGFSTESVQRAVENNKHNHLSATYYLLLKKYAQASYKSGQAARSSSVPSRVDARSSDYQAQKRTANKSLVQNSNSDSKNRSALVSNDNQTSSTGKSNNTVPSSGGSTSATNNNKYNKFRAKPGDDRLKAPVQDQLVLKNHRREQSANATAGRHNRNAEWGSVEDERRTESYGRPAPASDDYEIVISKVNKPSANAEDKKHPDGTRDSQNFNKNMRAHFASPSPDIGPGGSRGNRQSSTNQGKSGSTQNNAGIPKMNVTENRTKPMEVNIQNMKSSYNNNQVNTPSQTNGRSNSVVKQSLPKAATYTQATVSSTTRSNEKQRQASKQAERQTQQAQSAQQNSSNHRKTKSIAPSDIQKQNSMPNGNTHARDSRNSNLIDPSFIQDDSKFSQTQKIQNLTKSSGQQPRQQVISASGTSAPTSQTTKVSDLISNLNMITQQKTYFDHIVSKKSNQVNNNSSIEGKSLEQPYIPSKQSSAEQAAGIEGSNVSQGDTVVNVNKNGGVSSSGIFQSLTNVCQRPIIQDMNSQNLLKRLESGSSDNQLRQNFANRQSQQSNKNREQHQGSKADSRNNKSSPSRKDDTGKRSALQVENPKSQLSQFSHANGNHLGQPISKTPVTGYQTLDTMGDMSSHELKIPINPDTDRGVSKQIFYGTQKVSNMNQEISRYSNDKIQGNNNMNQVRDFSKTQALRASSNGYNSRSNTGHTNDRSTKNVTHRAESQNRPSSGIQSSKYAQSTKHSRQSTSTVVPTHTNQKKQENGGEASLNNSRTHMSSHQRQNNNGYSIPVQTQAQSQVTNTNAYSTVKNSSQKFQSLKVSSAVKVTPHVMPSQTIEAQTMSSKQGMSSNYAQLLQQSVTNHAAKKSQSVHKTRSQSVSAAAQKSNNMYTPASHRKGNSSNQNNMLLMSQPGNNPSASMMAHYRCSTASSTNKDRRSSQPPQQNHNANIHAPQTHLSSSMQVNHQPQQQNPGKQRSASSTNYQSSFLVKSLDGRASADQTAVVQSSQRTRQKSTRDSAGNQSFIQQMPPQDRQFQSITHVGGSGVNTSILSAPLDETIFNQSFNGGAGHYQTNSHHANSSSTYTKRRQQQVTNINELLNVAETLRQSSNGYQVRTRASNGNQQSDSQNDVRQLQSNNYMSSGQHSSLMLQQAQKTGVRSNKPTVELKSSQQPQSSTIQNELSASLLLSNPQQHSQKQQQNRGASHVTKQQNLTTAMKQITDGLLQRQQQSVQQQQPVQVQTTYQNQMNQSYLSDMFSKQQNSTKNQTNQLFQKKKTSSQVPVSLNSSLYGQHQSAPSQTQQVSLKQGIYSPNSRSKQQSQYSNNQTTIDAQQQDSSFSAYQHRSSYNGNKQATLDASSNPMPSQIPYSQQIQHHNHHYYPQQYYQQAMQASSQNSGGNGYQSQMPSGKEMLSGGQGQPASFNLLQHHQSTIQQLSGGYQSSSTPISGQNMMPQQQLVVNMNHNNSHYGAGGHHQQYQSVPQQPQKPPSVPAPSIAYQQMLQQQQQQHQQQQYMQNNHVNFYPTQGGSAPNQQPYM